MRGDCPARTFKIHLLSTTALFFAVFSLHFVVKVETARKYACLNARTFQKSPHCDVQKNLAQIAWARGQGRCLCVYAYSTCQRRKYFSQVSMCHTDTHAKTALQWESIRPVGLSPEPRHSHASVALDSMQGMLYILGG